MHAAVDAILDCGWAAWLCVLIGLVGAGAGVAGLVLVRTRARAAARVVGVVAIVLGILALVTGVAGQRLALWKIAAATSSEFLDPAQARRVRAEGAREAGQCVVVGVATGALPFVLGAVAVGIGFAAAKKARCAV